MAEAVLKKYLVSVLSPEVTDKEKVTDKENAISLSVKTSPDPY